MLDRNSLVGRHDGTFVGVVNGRPYHIIPGETYWAEAQEIASALGDGLPMEPPPAPLAPPQPLVIILTNRQLFAALAITGMITPAEALAAGRTGEVPAAVEAVFATLPPQDAFLARLTWATMRDVPRDHPLIAAMVAAGVATDEQVDALFALGASIP
jgi:hypothetical protein